MSLDKSLRVKYLKESYDNYTALHKYIETVSTQDNKKFAGVYDQELKLTNDMIVMMPNKIDKINYGMVSPLE
jgi:hypothetical protein